MKLNREIAALSFFGPLASAAAACCVAYGSHPISLAGEKVIIVWDAEEKLEHFVRQASFKGEAKDFGFIVPTPSKPEVAEADAKAFERLQAFVEKEIAKGSRGFGCSKPMDSAAAGSVELIEQYRVGDYEASILKATDGKSLLDWLEQNGYNSRPAMETWLDHYAKQSWFFAALKFVRAKEQVGEETSALRITFKTDVPHYPYKMPDDTWPAGHFRPLALYFIAAEEPQAVYRGTGERWEAEKQWAGPLPKAEYAGLAKEIGLKPEDLPKNAVLTALLNTENAQGYGRDLDFVMASGMSSLWKMVIGGSVAAVVVMVLRVRQKKAADR